MWTSQLSEMFIGKYEYMIVFSVFLGIQRFVQRQYVTGLGVEQTIFSVVFFCDFNKFAFGKFTSSPVS